MARSGSWTRTSRWLKRDRTRMVPGQVASQTRPEGGGPRRTRLYVEGGRRPRTKYGEANWPGGIGTRMVPGQVASQTRPEGGGSPRRTRLYVEGGRRPRTKYG